MKFFLTATFYFVFWVAFAQSGIDYALKNSGVKFKSIEDAVTFINASSLTEKEKAYAAYYWIAHNVSYDIRKFLKDKPSYMEPKQVFSKKKAVCIGYAKLFQEMCHQMNLQCEVITGYSKGYGYKKNQQFIDADHAWNTVKIDSVWYLVDPTWASGNIEEKTFRTKFHMDFNDKFFMASPDEFVETHLPEMPMWQLLNSPVPVKIFSASEDRVWMFLKNKPASEFNYADSIRTFLSLAEMPRSIKYGASAYKFNPLNTLPLAIEMMVSLQYKLKKDTTFDIESVRTIDSMMTVNTKAAELFKKNKTLKQSRKDIIVLGLRLSNDLSARLYLARALAIERTADFYNLSSFDSLKLNTGLILDALKKALNASKEANDPNLTRKINEYVCEKYIMFYDLYSSFGKRETDKKKIKIVERETGTLLQNARKNVPAKSKCFQKISQLK